MRRSKNPLADAIRSCYPALWSAFGLSFFINVSLLVSPLYSMQIYDRVLSSRNTTTLVLLTLIVVAFLILYGVLEYARSGILVRCGVIFESALRRPLFDSMMRAELDPAARQGQQVIRDAESIRDCISGGTASTLFDLPWTPIFIVLCFVLHPVLGLVALAGAAMLFSLALVAELVNKRQLERTTKLASEASGFAATVLRNGEAVRGLGMGDVVLDRWSGHQAAAVSAQATAHERSAALVALSKFARVGVQTGALCVGAWLAIDREISPGIIMAASILMGRALAPVEQVVAQWKRIVSARTAHKRLQQLFEMAPPREAKMHLPAPVGTLDVENILVAPLGSNRPSVRNVSFHLDAGRALPSSAPRPAESRASAALLPAFGR